jgi:prepilin-type N-terminal cleavage/methylation domain-containing protein
VRGTKPRGRRPARKRGERGFTLIELLVTLGVTVIGLTGLLSIHLATVRGNAATARGGSATATAQLTLEELRQTPIQTLIDTYGALPIVQEPLDTVAGPAGLTLNRTLSVTELTAASSNLVLIRVEVSWTDDGATPGEADGRYDHMVSLELVRTRQEAL